MPILLILSFIAFFYEFFLLGKGLFIGDILLVTIPHKIFISESLKSGVFPLWNPHMWAGFPEMSDISIGLFDPFNILYFIFPGLQGANIVFLFTIFMSLIGTYLLLKHDEIKKQFAFLGAMIFSFSGSMLNMVADIPRLESMAFLPWTILCLRHKKYLLTIVLLTFNFLTGRTQQFYMSVFFIFCYLVFYLQPANRLKNLLIFFVLLCTSIGLSTFALLPQLELLKFSPRLLGGLDYNTVWSLHPASFIRFFFANFWGVHNKGSFWGPDITYSFGYIGFLPIVFILLNLKKINEKHMFFFGFAIFAIVASLGKYTPIYQLFLFIPGFSYFRNPSSWLILYSFSLAYLASFLVQDVDFNFQKIFRKSCLFFGPLLLLIGFLMVMLPKFSPDLPHAFLQIIAKTVHKNLSLFHNVQVDKEISLFIGNNLLIIGLMLTILRLKFTKSVFIILVFFDLLFFAKNDIVTARLKQDPILNLKQSKVVDFLMKNLQTNRFVSTSEFVPVRGMSIYMTDYSRRPPYVDKKFWSLSQEELTSRDKYERQIELLPPNIFVSQNLSSINGYSGFYLKDFADYFSKPSENLSSSAKRVIEVREQNKDVVDPSHINFNLIALDDPRLSDIAVKYVLADEQLKLEDYKEIKFPNDFFIYENLKIRPRAEIVSSKNVKYKLPTIIDKNVNKVDVLLNTNIFSPGDYLVLKDANYPGWQAYNQNGEQLEILSFGAFRKVMLETGVSEVVFKFQPKSFQNGLIISFVTLSILLIWGVFLRRLKLFKI